MIRRALIPVFLLLLAAPATAELDTPKVYRDAEQAFLERTSLAIADDKCGYFTDIERSALESGRLQARGTLLRSGIFTPDAIEDAVGEIRLWANSRPCGQADFAEARDHLKNAFASFIGTMVMDYPGLVGEWNASRSRWDTWRVVQDGSAPSYLFQFGLLADVLKDPDDFPAAFARPLDAPIRDKPFDLALELKLTGDQPAPSLARIHLRSAEKAPEPWLGSIFKNKITPPPIGLTATYWASGREIITDEKTGDRAIRFRFPPEVTAHIEMLDPREQFQLSVTPDPRSGKTKPDYLTVEVGDFGAAHAFTKLPPL